MNVFADNSTVVPDVLDVIGAPTQVSLKWYKQGDVGASNLLTRWMHSRYRISRGKLYIWNRLDRLWLEHDLVALKNSIALEFKAMLRYEQDNCDIQQRLGAIDWQMALELAESLMENRKVSGIYEQLLTKLSMRNSEFADKLDSSRHELPLANGVVIDLRTKESRPRHQTDFWSRELKVNYREATEYPRAHQLFLEFANGDEQLCHYLQVLFGYQMTGENDQREFYIHLGQRRAGKSTWFSELWSAILGHFHKTVPAAVFMKATQLKQSGAASPELAAIAKARSLTVSELEDNMLLATALIKGLTGKDRFSYRDLYEKGMRECEAIMKINMPTNFAPAYESTTDDAMNERNKNVPWLNQFEKTAANKNKISGLLANGLDELFSWLVQGSAEYYTQRRLPDCHAVETATIAHIRTLDSVAQFMENFFEIDRTMICASNNSPTCIEVFQRYVQYCEDYNIEAKQRLGKDKFSKALVAKPYSLITVQTRLSGKRPRVYLGLRLRPEFEQENEPQPMEMGAAGAWVSGA